MSRWIGFAAVSVAAFFALGFALISIQWFVLGETECNRGECGSFGEFNESAGAGLFLIWGAIALLVALAAVRPRRRSGGQ